jgi:hypothetical protein
MAGVLFDLGGERCIRAQLREYRRRAFIPASAPTAEEQR